jgi:hypothetical protein
MAGRELRMCGLLDVENDTRYALSLFDDLNDLRNGSRINDNDSTAGFAIQRAAYAACDADDAIVHEMPTSLPVPRLHRDRQVFGPKVWRAPCPSDTGPAVHAGTGAAAGNADASASGDALRVHE